MEARRHRFDKIEKMILAKKIIHNTKVSDWCGLPYPGHPKGCPNYCSGKAKCPPVAPYITEIMDLDRPVYLVYSEFNLAAHMAKMKKRHPHWTERQQRNVLYWQSRSKKQMKERAAEAVRILGADTICTMGEAAGVNLYATCRLSGLKLEKIKGLKICRHVALVGWRPDTK